jgi:hypothetical protein
VRFNLDVCISDLDLESRAAACFEAAASRNKVLDPVSVLFERFYAFRNILVAEGNDPCRQYGRVFRAGLACQNN